MKNIKGITNTTVYVKQGADFDKKTNTNNDILVDTFLAEIKFKDEQIKNLKKANRNHKIMLEEHEETLKEAHKAFCIGETDEAFSILDKWAKGYWN